MFLFLGIHILFLCSLLNVVGWTSSWTLSNKSIAEEVRPGGDRLTRSSVKETGTECSAPDRFAFSPGHFITGIANSPSTPSQPGKSITISATWPLLRLFFLVCP
ncbi:hypothetical protein R1flu_000876 [Riccia fluitans]|uniref:Secreted protein n=1 Tax=Riccia fluitans TaxID=41844 RepID=A0ABD1Y217_9MARC